MKIDVLANEIRRIADALESIAKFQELERNNDQKKFDFSSKLIWLISSIYSSSKLIEGKVDLFRSIFQPLGVFVTITSG